MFRKYILINLLDINLQYKLLDNIISKIGKFVILNEFEYIVFNLM